MVGGTWNLVCKLLEWIPRGAFWKIWKFSKGGPKNPLFNRTWSMKRKFENFKGGTLSHEGAPSGGGPLLNTNPKLIFAVWATLHYPLGKGGQNIIKLDRELVFFPFKSAGVYWNSPAILFLNIFWWNLVLDSFLISLNEIWSQIF